MGGGQGGGCAGGRWGGVKGRAAGRAGVGWGVGGVGRKGGWGWWATSPYYNRKPDTTTRSPILQLGLDLGKTRNHHITTS